mmetsp:Transcript_7027/g.10076  ORF Transcript_7027/g.10076 Transcript_7027/m.10076 type:complete len:139 (+) Transcript_7027:209-625(+)|eukprot:CAMPEP_0184869198 /NCGR_PEP_ID=MMETSP0580-20130426/33325_1 /TAXON_ID=1118495 /ORGANISM="Dactyliosolen fragilissimus" /LENGTH=138 /DNA_ID=CAMNT_0027370527 /DNA_START=179 /DNA_END=595 /DNA_ORIENTATION=-
MSSSAAAGRTNTQYSASSSSRTAPRKDSILELAKYVDSMVQVKCLGGRQLKGTLRGYDELVNLVLDECHEFIRDPNDLSTLTGQTRKLGLVVVRGTQVSLVSPDEGTEEISNPFIADDDDDDDGHDHDNNMDNSGNGT